MNGSPPHVDLLGEVVALVSSLTADTIDALSDHEFDRLAHDAARVKAAVGALWLRVAAGAERRQAHRRHLARDAGSWLAQVAGEKPGSARADVHLAHAVHEAPLVAEALASGVLSVAKAAELAGAAQLPAEVQSELIAEAVGASVAEVGVAVRSARIEHGCAEPVAAPSTVRVRRTADRVRVEADLDLVSGETVEVALDTMAEALSLPAWMSYERRRAEALVALARRFLDAAPQLPSGRLGRPHVIVMVDLEVLEARTGGQARLGSGAVITGDQARRLALDANVSRVVTAGRSEVLDAGRTTRSVPPAQARAVVARDRHCRWHGCSAPPWACEIHHRVPWARGGTTDLANLGLLCWHHHQVLHANDAERLAEDPDGRWRLGPPRAGDRGSATHEHESHRELVLL